MAGITIAARTGFETKNALEIAKKTYVDINIFDDEHKEKLKDLRQLPTSCFESSKMLLEQKDIYCKYDVFPESVIDLLAKQLADHNDAGLISRIQDDEEKVMELVTKYYHCG